MNHKKNTTSIKEMFIEGFGLNPEELQVDKAYLVEEANIGIQTQDKDGKKVFSKVIRAIKKSKTQMYKITLLDGKDLRAACNHRIAVLKNANVEWITLEEIFNLKDSFNLPIITEDGLSEFLSITPDGIDYPLDIEVEGNHSYFSEGILSHNSMYGPDFKATGGYAPKYYSSWMARVTRTGDIVDPQTKELVGIEMRVRNIKNKIGIPKRDATLKLYFNGGIRSDDEYIDYLKALGLVEQKGAYYSNPSWISDDGVPGMKVCGLEAVKDWLHANPKMYEKVKVMVNERIAGHTSIDEEEPAEDIGDLSDTEGINTWAPGADGVPILEEASTLL